MERYDFYSDGFDNCEMRKSESGEYVTFDDHKKELDMVIESLKELMSIVKIHSENSGNDFAWAEMSEANRTLRSLTTAST
jgi:hypothetical protein